MALHAKAEVELHDKRLELLQGEIHEVFENLPTSDRRQQDLDDLDDKIRSFDNALAMLRVEVGSLSAEDKKVYRKRCRDYEKALDKMQVDSEYHKNLSVKNELLGDHPADDTKINLDTNAGLMAYGRQTLGDSKESLARSHAAIVATRDVATATAIQMDKQQKQLQNAMMNIGAIESTLARTNKAIMRIARKLSTDKLLWVIIALVIIAVIAIIVYKQFFNKNAPVYTGLPSN